jgi:putative transferase (TIGR04331 family)
MELPRYSYWLYSIPIASQFLNYLEDQFRFIEALSPLAKEELFVRLFPRDFGWAQRERFIEKFPWLLIDDAKISIFERMKDIRLYVATYNATTFLESLYLNIPTIMFWDFKFWEINQLAKPYFDELVLIGILHDSPDSAANKINEIWNDVESWWESREIQNARINFCSRFSREVNEPIKLLQTSLSSISELRMN